jgi:hypothetical protein
MGLPRNEILTQTKRLDGGSLTRRLKDLCECGFVNKYYVHGRVEALYQLVDFYSLFYFQFLQPAQKKKQIVWREQMLTSGYATWCGLAFERLCFAHILQIKHALGIAGVSTQTYALYKENAQIDMVIERSDKVVDLCEIKFTDRPYALSKREAELLSNRMDVLLQSFKSRRTVETVLITNQNAVRNMHYNGLINKNITLDDLINS